eukprot:g14055.t1
MLCFDLIPNFSFDPIWCLLLRFPLVPLSGIIFVQWIYSGDERFLNYSNKMKEEVSYRVLVTFQSTLPRPSPLFPGAVQILGYVTTALSDYVVGY